MRPGTRRPRECQDPTYPNDADVLAEFGWALAAVGRAEEGIESVKTAIRLNPHYHEWYIWILGITYYDARRYAETATILESINHPNLVSRKYLAASYGQLGHEKEARLQVGEILRIEPEASLRRESSLQVYKHLADQGHYLDGLPKAGLPE